MGNVLESLVSGFTKVLAKPLDFLSGKACSTVCGSTWDIFCYIENFCVASLAKTAATLFLLYLALLFFYVVYKLGICRCVCHVISKILCSCLSCSSSACKHGCARICNKMRSIKHARQRRPRRRHPRHDDVEQGHFSSSDSDSPEDTTTTRHRHAATRHGGSEGSMSRRRVYLERSLRPRNHRVTVGISRRSAVVVHGDREEPTRVNHRHDGSESDRVLHHHHGIKNGAHYMIYTPVDPLLFVAVKDLMDDPSIVSAIDEETEFTALVEEEEEEALLESILHGDDDVS